ncbi:MAG: amino acid ABC transporter substrate-binding protein [Desulfobacterales bacterium]|nr:amino acid ABC transporter substrate-binding protein [Desulfobacterales bacterium]
MGKKLIILMTLLLILPSLATGEIPEQKPVVILYTDAENTINLDDLSTVSQKTNRIIHYMLKEVLPRKYGISIKLKPIQWSRGLELIKLGFADGIINASYNKDRATYAVYPMKDGKHNPAKRLKGIAYMLYKNKNSSIEWDGKKITGIDGDIGAVKSFAIVKDLRKMGIKVKEFQSELGIMKDVAIGKLKATGMQDYIADVRIEKEPFLRENIVKLPIPLKKKDYYLIFSKKFYKEHKDTAEAIWDKYEEHSKCDEYKRIRSEFEK